MNIPAFITVRSQSTRLHEKCFLPFGDGNVLDHIIQRCLHYDLRPIVCTTSLTADEKIIDIAKENGVEFFQGQPINKLMRWKDCANKYNFECLEEARG